MTDETTTCSFCGTSQSADVPLIAGLSGYICESCVGLAAKVVGNWGRKRTLRKPLQAPPVPQQIKQHLDRYVIGQDAAKQTLAVAVYNHYKRLRADTSTVAATLDDDGGVEIEKSNILLLGPSGTGKTLLVSTLARIVGVPCVVADATTLTQAGYVGDDVDTLLARLLDVADGDGDRVAAHYRREVRRELLADHRMSAVLNRLLARPLLARGAVRVVGLNAFTRRNFVRWMFEDEPRAVVLTPRRWHRAFLRRPAPF